MASEFAFDLAQLLEILVECNRSRWRRITILSSLLLEFGVRAVEELTKESQTPAGVVALLLMFVDDFI